MNLSAVPFSAASLGGVDCPATGMPRRRAVIRSTTNLAAAWCSIHDIQNNRFPKRHNRLRRARLSVPRERGRERTNAQTPSTSPAKPTLLDVPHALKADIDNR
jgi:hypothetical protein